MGAACPLRNGCIETAQESVTCLDYEFQFLNGIPSKPKAATADEVHFHLEVHFYLENTSMFCSATPTGFVIKILVQSFKCYF